MTLQFFHTSEVKGTYYATNGTKFSTVSVTLQIRCTCHLDGRYPEAAPILPISLGRCRWCARLLAHTINGRSCVHKVQLILGWLTDDRISTIGHSGFLQHQDFYEGMIEDTERLIWNKICCISAQNAAVSTITFTIRYFQKCMHETSAC